jgi:flagellar basal body-associated protein FliL
LTGDDQSCPEISLSVDSTEGSVNSGADAHPVPLVLDGGLRIAFPKYVPGEKKKNVKSRGLAFLIPMVILAGAGIWFWANRGAEAATEAPRVRSTLHLETFVLNLADTDQRSYLRVGIDLGLSQEAKHGEETLPVAQVRDTILSVLGEAKLNDLMTAAGKAKLKENLLHALQERLPRLGVDEVYFTEFLIQR